MKQIRIAGLAFMAMLTLSAVAASGAQAAEYGKCERVKATGGYTNEGCTTVSGTHKGNFEWLPIAKGSKITYTTVPPNKVTIKAGWLNQSECGPGGRTDAGAITGPTEGEVTTTLSGCTVDSSACTTKGAETGKIITPVLATNLFDSEGKVWTESISKAGGAGTQAEFRCGPIPYRLFGSLSGVTTPLNTMTKSFETSFQLLAAGQNLEMEIEKEVVGEHFLEATHVTTKTSESIEIKP